jgi:serine/threonine-protein kinase
VARSCPTCGKTYPDAVFFCGEDGTIVIQDQDAKDFDGRLGARLGGYVVVARVADGAMGRVFEGRHPETKARVAIKVLHKEVARDRVAVERFKREYETALELDHPHIVKVLEFGATSDGSPFLTMEYLEGEEVGKVLGRGKPMAHARIVRVVSQVALALEYAHSFGFIHRDLKPDNIFMCRTPDGDSVRILDYGSVKLQVEMGAKLTAIGTTVGSPFYMSPEQAMGRADVDQRTDVFALGAILYEMLTDKVAFDAPNIAKILLRIMHEQPVPPSSVRAETPRALDGVIDRALRKDKAERFASAREFADATIAAFGLSGRVEDWAARPAAEIEAELEKTRAKAAAPAVAPAAAPAVAPAAEANAAAFAATVRADSLPGIAVAARSSTDRGDPTVPKLALAADDGETSSLPSSNNVGMMMLIGICVVVAGVVFVLLR